MEVFIQHAVVGEDVGAVYLDMNNVLRLGLMDCTRSANSRPFIFGMTTSVMSSWIRPVCFWARLKASLAVLAARTV